MKILIIDDHAIVRRGLCRVLKENFPELAISEAKSGQEALNVFQEHDFDVVILDIGLPDTMGLEVLKVMKHTKPKIPVVILSLYSEEQYALRAIRSGASAYLTKETAPDELITALKKVLDGESYVSATMAEQLAADWKGHHSVPLVNSLSERELEVLGLFGHGKTVTDIAKQLNLSVKTVSTYRTRLMEKLNLRNNPELIRFAVGHNLVI